MAKEIIMPKFGFTQEESEILEWLKQEGDPVEKGDPVAIVSTDKISMEIEAPESGILKGVRFGVGDVVPVTETIAYILQPGEALPEAGEGKKAEKQEQPTRPKETIEKTSDVLISPVAQRLAEDRHVDVRLVQGSGKNGQITKSDVEAYLAGISSASGKVKITPAARRMAEQKLIDLRGLKGSGPGGRIQAADVEAAIREQAGQSPEAGLKVLKEIPMIGMRRTIARNMQRSMQEAPHMTLQIDVELDAAEALRHSLNEKKKNKADKISITALIVQATAQALKSHPIVNSRYSDEKVILYSDIHIGIATALEEGLIVPVIHHTDEKGLAQISQELNDLAQRARDARLQPEDLAGGTFTISNLGMYGIDRFTAIINPPQAAILAVGKMRRVFMPDEQDNAVVRRVATFTLSADHRVMDGVQAAMFLAELKNNLEHFEEEVK